MQKRQQVLHTTVSRPKNPRHGVSLILPEDQTESVLTIRMDDETEEEPRFIAIVIKTTTLQKMMITLKAEEQQLKE